MYNNARNINALFVTCAPILVVYFVVLCCVLLIAIVLHRCLFSSFMDTKDYDGNNIEIGTPSVAYVYQLKRSKEKLVENIILSKAKRTGSNKQIASDISLSQMELQQMFANHNKIKPSYI